MMNEIPIRATNTNDNLSSTNSSSGNGTREQSAPSAQIDLGAEKQICAIKVQFKEGGDEVKFFYHTTFNKRNNIYRVSQNWLRCWLDIRLEGLGDKGLSITHLYHHNSHVLVLAGIKKSNAPETMKRCYLF